MTNAIIIVICSLLLFAYLFEISSRLTKIPSVLLLLLLGILVRESLLGFQIVSPDFNPMLPIFGTIGLILIVLEGALELELNRSKLTIILKSIVLSLLPMSLLAVLMGYVFQYFANGSFKLNLLNAIPFCVISSAIAIPSAKTLSKITRESITYESSLSDIFGVLLFNFIAINSTINTGSVVLFGIDIVVIILVSLLAIAGLSFLLSRIKHHVTYTPMILLIILIYTISKAYHLPALIFILVFGLFLGNIHQLRRFKWFNRLRPEKLEREVLKFKEITVEATFLIRALFFILFGFLMNVTDILNLESLPWAVGILVAILILRAITLLIVRLPVFPLLFFAPRGLITILLFLSIAEDQLNDIVNTSLITQVIVLSVLIMMFGLFSEKKALKNPLLPSSQDAQAREANVK